MLYFLIGFIIIARPGFKITKERKINKESISLWSGLYKLKIMFKGMLHQFIEMAVIILITQILLSEIN